MNESVIVQNGRIYIDGLLLTESLASAYVSTGDALQDDIDRGGVSEADIDYGQGVLDGMQQIGLFIVGLVETRIDELRA